MRNNEILSTESFIVDESYLSFDEFFSITLRQDSPDLGHVTEVKEGHPRNPFYMREKSHVLVEDTPRFLTVVLEDNALPSRKRMLLDNLVFRCLIVRNWRSCSLYVFETHLVPG